MENENKRKSFLKVGIIGHSGIGLTASLAGIHHRPSHSHAIEDAVERHSEAIQSTIIVINSDISELELKVLEAIKTRYADKFDLQILTTEMLASTAINEDALATPDEIFRLAECFQRGDRLAEIDRQEEMLKHRVQMIIDLPMIAEKDFMPIHNEVVVPATVKPKVVQHNKKHNPRNVHTKSKFTQKFNQRRFT